jgi:DDE superfamily endonuclease
LSFLFSFIGAKVCIDSNKLQSTMSSETNNYGKEKKKTRRKFSLAKKEAIMEKGKRIGKRKAAAEEGIGYDLLKDWYRQKVQLNNFASTRGVNAIVRSRLDGGGRPPLIKKATENTLCDWFDHMRDDLTDGGSLKVNIPMCISKIRQIDNSLQQVSRVVLRRRIWRIFKRRGITERAITHHQQKTRECSSIIEGWAAYIKEKMEMIGITHTNLCNFDETNVFFSPQSKKTLAHKGSKTVSALKAESTQRCTAMIGVTGDGDGFPPYIIYKGKDSDRGLIYPQLKRVMAARHEVEVYDGYPTSNYYAVQENAWMDSELVVDWVNYVFRPWAETKDGPTLLLLDEFTGHMTSEVREAVSDCGAFLEFIPGGYTWRLQVMDVGVNKTFKDVVRDEHDAWSLLTNFDAKPQREDVATWIKTAYDGIKPRTITKTWARVGLPSPQIVNNNNNNEININNNNNNDYDSDEDEEFDNLLDYLQLCTIDRTEEEVEADNHYNDNGSDADN